MLAFIESHRLRRLSAIGSVNEDVCRGNTFDGHLGCNDGSVDYNTMAAIPIDRRCCGEAYYQEETGNESQAPPRDNCRVFIFLVGLFVCVFWIIVRPMIVT